jgi:hypothetical protein
MGRQARHLAIATLFCLTLATCHSGPADAAHVRYAGHVRLARTSCCGFNQVVFKAFGRADVHYRVCVVKPSGHKSCRNAVTGAPGEPSTENFISSAIGSYRVLWKVDGHIVDRASWVNTAEGV